VANKIRNTARNFHAPALPNPPAEYSQALTHQRDTTLRIYFQNIDEAITQALQYDTSDIIDGSIPNSKLENSTISFGGVTLSLGGSDATPAFDLSDATGYPTSSLVGTITTAQIADDAVTDAKLANSINSAIAANTAKVTNATHTGEVTGATALTIADGAVVTARIADDAVTGDKIAHNTITSTNMNTASVSATALQSNAVTTTKIADANVTTAKIADDAVTPAKLSHDYLRADANDSTAFTVGFGAVTVTNTLTVGYNSVTTGGGSVVAGNQHAAGGPNCLVSGYNNTVSGSLNNVSGQGNTASSSVGITTGYQNTSYSGADRSIIGGYGNYGLAENCLLVGSTNSISTGGANSIVGGYNNISAGNNCLVVGYQCYAGASTKWFSTAIGYQSQALGTASFAGGRATYDGGTKRTQVDADAGFSYGTGNRIYTNAPSSVALGTLTACGEPTPASGVTAAQSMAIGYKSIAYKDNSFAGGNQSYAFGDTSFAFGNGSVASNGFSNIALGRGVTTPVSGGAATTTGAVTVGQWNNFNVTTDQHFSVGTGTGDFSRYTSMYVGARSSSDSGIVMQALKDSASYTTDSAAALGGVPLGGIYRTSNTVKIRMT